MGKRRYCIFILFLIFFVLVSGSNRALAGGKGELILTVLYDNNPHDERLETRWGFSCLVQGAQKTILFDLGGEGPVLLSNMKTLGIDPQVVDVVVLSHIHMDHIGGLDDFLQKNPMVTVFMPASFPESLKEKVRRTGARLILVSGSEKVCENVYTTGELGDYIKEQSLIIETEKGIVIVTGCAHPGVIDIVKTAKRIMNQDIYLILGGFHLCWMSPSQLKRVLRGVKNEGVFKVAPSHCSGDLARKVFEKAYGKNFISVGAGKTIEIDDAF